jgi:hypothetical protein
MSGKKSDEPFLRVVNRRLVYALCVVIVLFAWMAQWSARHPLTLPFFLFTPWMAILIHELGHAFAASLIGWRVWVVNAYPFAWRRASPTIVTCKNDIGSDVGGFVLASPKTQSRHTLARQIILTAGGPVASISVAVICIAMTMIAWPYFFYEDFYAHQPYRLLIFAFGLHSAACALASTWPFVSKDGTRNDAAKILYLLLTQKSSSPKTDQADYANQLWEYGVTPRSWDNWIAKGIEAAAERPNAAPDHPYWLGMRALERDDYALARKLFAGLKLPTESLDALLVLEAFFAAMIDKHAGRAEALLAGVRTGMGGDLYYFRQLTVALLVAADGDHNGAQARLDSLHDQLQTAHYPNSFWRPLLNRAKTIVPDIKMQHEARRFSPSTARNREAILAVIAQHFPVSGTVLEIASGAGEHAVFFARALPGLTWQPSDPDEAAHESIAAWTAHEHVRNVLPPLTIDARQSNWGVDGPFDAIVAINMIHIAPWDATIGLMAGAAHLLAPGGKLFLYGPYKRNGAHTAPSNEAFDASLRARNPLWGVRDLEDVEREAQLNGLTLSAVVEMPANNLSVIFAKG